jgi:uncharacterized protein
MFGGDPASQVVETLAAVYRLALDRKSRREHAWPREWSRRAAVPEPGHGFISWRSLMKVEVATAADQVIEAKIMSEDNNVLLVRGAYRATAQGDTSALMNVLAADVVWRLPQMQGVPFAGEWHGREGVAKFFAAVAQSQEVLDFEPEQFIAQGASVVVLGHFTMRVKATGRISRSHWAHVWTVASEQVSMFREYVDTAAVIAAHGQ